MKTKLLFFFLILLPMSLLSQVPQGFNYQAIARDGSGNPLISKDIQVRVSILSDTTGFYTSGSGTYLWEEQHAVRTNGLGLFNLVIGTKTKLQGSVASFNLIDWSKGPLFVGVKIQYISPSWKNMGTAKLNSVPYSMLADKANGVIAGSKLSVTSNNDTGTDALFEVKRKDGQTVFAVYPDAVNIYVPRSVSKGSKGGFAIGGFDGSKATPQDYFRVTPDSVRIYIDPTPPQGKGSKGGFAIGGYDGSKGINNMYFNLTGSTSVNTVAESPQILWYPTKKAFLAGSIHIGSVDSVGQNSTALGYRSIAMGDYSQAFGYKAKAFGDYSTSIGKNSVAGSRSAPLANNAFAFGNGTKATGNDSYAFGSAAEASGTTSIALGMNAKATNSNSLALGNGTIASGTNSTAMGYQSQSQGDKSIAIGSFYSYSYLIPIINIAGKGGSDSSSSSKGSEAFLPIRPITPISTFIKNFSRANTASGQYSVAIGNGNLSQNGGFVFGSNSDALQFGALALGTSAAANQLNSIAMGYNTVANGIYSVAIGNNIAANSYGELALGQWSETATGTASSWDENDLLLSLGNGVNDANRSNAMTIYKNGKTILRGRYAVSTFNYQALRLLYNPITHLFFTKDYVYGIYTNLNRDDTNIEYYYSGYFGATGTAGTYYGLYADIRSGASIDVAEYIYDTQANTEAADVVVADPLNKESIIKSSKPYQSAVLGVISTKPHMTMGMELITDEKTGKPLSNAKPAARLALTGRVPVKVTGENGPIIPGDLLTSSSTQGCAMKWTLLDVNGAKDFDDLKRILSENEKRRGAVIGKAVEGFSDTGTGKIMILISMQ
jgi:Head domain of trimeric autotransporter adhesin